MVCVGGRDVAGTGPEADCGVVTVGWMLLVDCKDVRIPVHHVLFA